MAMSLARRFLEVDLNKNHIVVHVCCLINWRMLLVMVKRRNKWAVAYVRREAFVRLYFGK